MVTVSKKQDNKNRLLDIGVALLTEKGYHGTGIKEILDTANIPKGSFYNYFPSKEVYGAEVIRHYIAPFIRQIEDDLANHDGDALAALETYFQRLIDDLQENQYQGGCLLGNLLGEIGDTSDKCRSALAEAVNDYAVTLATGLALAQRQGALRRDLSSREMADLLVNAWQGALLRMKIEHSIQPLEQCVDSLLQGYFRSGN